MIVKKLIYVLIASLNSLLIPFTHSASIIEDTIDPKGPTIVNGGGQGKQDIQNYLIFAKDLLFSLLWIIVVGAFLYVGYLFISARGKPDEFKKAWMHVVYIIIGIAMVSSAWGIVSLIAGIDL